jgi:hypothetical protein
LFGAGQQRALLKNRPHQPINYRTYQTD